MANRRMLAKSISLSEIEPAPAADNLFGILKTVAPVQPAHIDQLREAMSDERTQSLGYDDKGEIVMQNSSRLAIRDAQAELKEVDLAEADVIREVRSLRYGKKS